MRAACALAAVLPMAAVGAPCRGVAVSSTHELIDAIDRQEPEVCLRSSYYPLDAQLNLTASINLTAAVLGGARLDARGSEAQPRRVMRVGVNATVVLTGIVVAGGWAPTVTYSALGGGILNEGVLTLHHCTVADNYGQVHHTQSSRHEGATGRR